MNLQTVKNQKGFTIVELLIVIVVIGILAAITIVAFNGIQNRANQTAAESVANSVVKKLEAWNSVVGAYPTYCQFATNSIAPTGAAPTTAVGVGTCAAGGATGPVEAKLDNVNSIATGGVDGTNGKTAVVLSNISTAGVRVNYWNYTASTPAITSASTTPRSPVAGNP